MQLHPNQAKLLKYLKGLEDLEGLSLWDIARETNLNNAQTVSHHLKQLERYGYLRRDLADPNQFEILKDPIEDVLYINLFGFAQCGNETDFFSTGNLKEKIAISTRLFGISSAQNSFLVRAKGDSMSPEIAEKDLVLFDRQTDVDSGSIALVIDDEEPKIKKVFKKSRNEYILNSLNKKVEDKIVKVGTDFRILGLAKTVIRGL
ncbi:MAG: S24 family peptidase [Candidatus Pacebacteria bacterium]|nr:S24 family peptidase [Candidatus Paceibacterota bacterium]